MKKTATPQSGIEKPGYGPLITKGILLLLFLIGLGIIAMGMTGMREYGDSGFRSMDSTAYYPSPDSVSS